MSVYQPTNLAARFSGPPVDKMWATRGQKADCGRLTTFGVSAHGPHTVEETSKLSTCG